MSFCTNKYVLDSCCGCGWSTRKIADVAKMVIGIDISGEAIKVAEDKYSADNTTYLQMDSICMDFKNNTFDTIVSLEAIEHFSKKDVHTYLAENKRVLKSGGMFVGSTPRAKTFIHEILYRRRNIYHKKIYNKKSLACLLGKYFTNIKIIEKKQNNYLLFYCEKP